VTVVIRPAESRDIARLEEIENAADLLLVELLRPAHWDPAPSGDTRVAMPGFVLVVGDSIDGDAVGFVHVIESTGHAHVEQLSVLPSHARRGFGRALVEAAKAEASQRGYERMTLRTYADIPWNAPFYATCGFEESRPESAFHRQLAQTEEKLGLGQYGRRVQMLARLPRRS
jgi:GNAT superfamily N-acetyltransferase